MPYPRLTMRTRIRARDLLSAESSSAKITAPWTVTKKQNDDYEVKRNNPQTSKDMKSTNRSLLCNGCSGTPSKTRLFPACRGWWLRRSRTGSATDPSSNRRTRRAREPRTARTRCTWSWRTATHKRERKRGRFVCHTITIQTQTPSLYIIYSTHHHEGPVCWRRVVMWSLHLDFHWGQKTDKRHELKQISERVKWDAARFSLVKAKRSCSTATSSSSARDTGCTFTMNRYGLSSQALATALRTCTEMFVSKESF